MFGDLIPEHKIPRGRQIKSAAEVNAWMENRAQIESENLDEMRDALDRQEHKTAQFTSWASSTRRVCDALQTAGIDPAKVIYEEAVNKAETLSTRHGSDVGEETERPVR